MSERKKSIVGIDPGSTSAVAVLDLRGNLRKLDSGRHMGKEEIIKTVADEGKPVLITSDKEKTPSTVEEVATSFGAEIFTPEEDLSISGKKELTRKHNYENTHERDALASAINAYNNFKNKFKNIEARMDDLNLQDLTPTVKEYVIVGKASSVAEAVEIALGGDENDKDNKKDRVKQGYTKEELEEKINNYRKIIIKERKDRKRLKEHNEKLKKQTKALKSRLEKLEEEKEREVEKVEKEVLEKKKIKKLRRNIRSKESRIRNLEETKRELEETVSRLKTIDRLRRTGRIPIRHIRKLSEESIRKEEKKFSLSNSVILTDGIEGDMEELTEFLKEHGVRVVLGSFPEEVVDIFVSEGMWSGDPEEVEIEEEDGIKHMDPDGIESLKGEKKDSFISWLKRYKERRV